MNGIVLEKIFSWLIRVGVYLLPFSLLYVENNFFFPYITAKNFAFRIIVGIIFAAWLCLLLINFKKYWPRWNLLGLSFCFLILVALLSAIFGVDFQHSFWSNFERMEGVVSYLHLLALFFVLAGFFKSKEEWLVVFGVSILASIFLALFGFLEYFGLVGRGGGVRVIATLGNPLYVAAYLSFNAFLILFFWFSVRQKILRWFLLAPLLIFEFLVFFMTGSRGAFLGAVFGFGAMFLLSFFVVKSKRKKIAIVTVVLLLFLLPIFLNLIKDTSLIKESNVFARFSDISLTDKTVQARFTIWGMAFDSFNERPVLGWGVGNFIFPFAKNHDVRMIGNEPWFDRTHSMPFEWLSAAGIFGIVSYLAFFFFIFFSIYQAFRRSTFGAWVALAFVGMFISYGVQMLFVFDSLATHLMLVFILGFLFVASGGELTAWNNSSLFSFDKSKSLPQKSQMKKMSKKEKRNLRRQENQKEKKSLLPEISLTRLLGMSAIFVLLVVLLVFINIKPAMASKVLIDGMRSVNANNYILAKSFFERALSLSGGTIGIEEIREHLAINALGILRKPGSLELPGARDFYLLALDEAETQNQHNRGDYLNIKQIIPLAQLYSGLGIVDKNGEMIDKAVAEYERAINFAPNYIRLYPMLSQLYFRFGHLEQAVALTEEAEKKLTEAGEYYDDVYYNKALYNTALGNYDKALEVLKLSQNKTSRLLKNRLTGILETAARKGQETLPFIEEIYHLDEDMGVSSLVLSRMHLRFGEKEKAEIYANRAIELDVSLKNEAEKVLNSLRDREKVGFDGLDIENGVAQEDVVGN